MLFDWRVGKGSISFKPLSFLALDGLFDPPFLIFSIFTGWGTTLLERCESFMTCTVSDRGDLFLNRRLPSLHDGKGVRADALNDAMIEDILLRFVENAQGSRSVAEMTTDYDPAGAWPQ